jgi:excinuclease ABC subunit A
MMKKRVSAYMLSTICSSCHGKRLRPAALTVKFAGHDIAEISALALKRLMTTVAPYADGGQLRANSPERALVTKRIVSEIIARLHVLLDLGLGYLSLERSTPTLSPGELQRLRLATQLHSNLFGFVYVLDEPSAGLHPSDTESLMRALDALKRFGNSLFVVEHEIDVIKHADWLVDVGPAAGQAGGQIL